MKLPLACHDRFISSASGELVGQSLGSLCLQYIVMDRKPLAGDAGMRESCEQQREQEQEQVRWNTESSVGTSEDGDNSPSGMLSKSLVSRESASVFHSASDFLDDAPAEALRNAPSRLLASIGAFSSRTELGENELRLAEGNPLAFGVVTAPPQHRRRADTVPGFPLAREHRAPSRLPDDVDPASDGESSHSAVCLSDCHSAGPPSPTTISNVLDRYFHPFEERIRSRVKLMCTFGGRIMSRPVNGKLRNVGGETRIHTVNRGIGYDKFMTKMAQLYGAPLTLKYQLPDEGLDALVSISSDDDFQNMMEEYDKLESGGGVSRLRLFFFTSHVEYEASAQFGSKNETEERCSSSEQRYVAALNGVQEKISVNHLEDDAMGFRHEDGPDFSGPRMLRDDLSTGLTWSVSPVKTFSRAPSTPSSPPLSPSLAIRQAHLKPLRMGDSSFQISKERLNSGNINRRGLEANCCLDIDQNGSSNSSYASHADYQYRKPSGSPRRTQHEISASRGEGWRTVQTGMHRVNSQTRLNRPSEQQMDCGTVAGLKDAQTGMRRVNSQTRLMRPSEQQMDCGTVAGFKDVHTGMHRVNSQTTLMRPSEQQMDCGTVAGFKDVQTGMHRVNSQTTLMRPSEQQMDCGTVPRLKDVQTGMHRVNSQTRVSRPFEQQMDCGTVPGLKVVQTGMHRVDSQTRLSRPYEQQMDCGTVVGLKDVQTGMHRVNSQTRLVRPSEQQMDCGTVAGLKDVQQPSEMLLPLGEHQRFHYQQHQWIPQQQQQLAWQSPMEGNLGRGETMQRYPLDVHRQPHAFHQTREAVQQLHQSTQLCVHQTAAGHDFGCTQDSDIQGVPPFLQGSVQSHPQIALGLASAPSYQRGSAPSSPRIIHDCKGRCNCAQHHSQVHRGINVCLNDQSYSRRQPHLGDQADRKHASPQHVNDQPTKKHEFPDSSGLCDDASHFVERVVWQQHTGHFTVPEVEVGNSWRHVHERDAAQCYVADCKATSRAPQYCDSPVFTETSSSSSDHQRETNSTRWPRNGCYDDRWEAVVHPVYVDVQDQVGRWVTQRRSLDLDDGTIPAPGLGHILLHKNGGWRGELEVAERSEAEWELYYNHARGDFESKRPLEIPVARAPHPGNFPMHTLPISRPLASEEMLISQASMTSSHREVKQHPKLVALNASGVVPSSSPPSTEPKGWSDTPPSVIGHVPHTLLEEGTKISLSQAMPTTHCTSNSFLVRQGASGLENISACKGLFSGKHGQVLGFCASESFVRDDTGRLIAASKVAGEAPSELLSALSLTAGFAEGSCNSNQTSTTDGHAHLLSRHSIIPVGSLAPLEVASALTQQTYPPVASSMTTLEGLTSLTSPIYDPSPLSSTDTTEFSFEPSEACPIEGGAILDKEALMSSKSVTGLPADGMLSSIQKLRSNGEHCDESRVVDHEVANMNLHEVGKNNAEQDKGTMMGGLNTISPSSTDKAKGRAEAVNDWVREKSEKEQLPVMGPVVQNDQTKEDACEEKDVAAGNVCVNEGKGSALTQAEAEARARSLQIIKNADLEELKELGSGAFGTVFHGKWRGSDVAIKRIKASCFMGRPSDQERLISDFLKEACTLSQLHHPNVVAFYGVVPDGPEGTFATVTEYMVNGSLKQVLRKKDRTIDRRKRLLIGMGAAFGMEYLHSKNIVHFDLKCENLLVNMKDGQRPICKVGDFGLSKVKHQTMVSGGVRGTLPWMAPELLSSNSNMVTEKVDVFSFGIVMWELLTGEEPYANMHYGSIIGGIVKNTLRPSIPSWCEPGWRALMERCWSSDPADRPAFSEVARELRALAASMNVR